MSKKDKTRNFIYIDAEDFDFYQELKKSHYFNDSSIKNIDIFVFAALIGLNVVGSPWPMNDVSKRKDYLRVNDNKNKEAKINDESVNGYKVSVSGANLDKIEFDGSVRESNYFVQIKDSKGSK